jgi:protoporphyrinogen oxidase
MKIAIIGGGLTGLTAAFILSKKHDVTLFEKEDYLGGMASSYLVEWDGGKYPITKTYHHVLDGDLTTIEFIRKFGLEKKFHRKKVKQGFIYKNKIFGFSTPLEILKFPTSFSDKFKLAKFILLDLKQKDLSKLDDINAKRWITKKAGGTNYNMFFKQLIKNKFHDSPENITASWVITRLAKESSSFLKKFGWLEGGVVQIINGFEDCIKKNNGKIIMNAEVTSIRNKDKKLIYIKNGLKKEFKFNILISTIPPEVFLKVMDNAPDDIKEQLQKIRYLSCICATFGLKKSLTGYYWLNVLDEGLPFSVVFNDTTLYEDASPKNKSVVYITTYLMNNEDLWKMSEEEIKAVYVDSIKKIIPGFEEQIEWWRIFKLKYAEAIYKVGFVNPPMNYDGIYFAGIYKIYPKIRNMASAMEEGEKIAEKITSDYNT